MEIKQVQKVRNFSFYLFLCIRCNNTKQVRWDFKDQLPTILLKTTELTSKNFLKLGL